LDSKIVIFDKVMVVTYMVNDKASVELEVQDRSLILKVPEHPRAQWEASFAKTPQPESTREEQDWQALGNHFDDDEWKWR